WEISGHPKFPNRFGPDGEYQLDVIGRQAPELLFGPTNVKRFGNEAPFLTKLLNSGSWNVYRTQLKGIVSDEALAGNNHELHMALTELAKTDPDLAALHTRMLASNLSVQIHPDAAYAKGNPKWHSKSEMWVVLAVEHGAGFYLGLKEGVTEDQMTEALRAHKDASVFLNFIAVKPGDVFFIPAGTPHAIGAGVLLLEQQETSETTFRYYDWGRTDAQGNPRELHVKDAVASTHWAAPRGIAGVNAKLRYEPRIVSDGSDKTARHEILAAEPLFSYDRVFVHSNQLFESDATQGMHGITVTKGAVVVLNGRGVEAGAFKAGQSIVIPAGMGAYNLMSAAQQHAEVYIGRSDPRKINSNHG
ncbi:MAG: hypothetical protein ABIA59_09020, partial [Candidatus Latescibacterota bacterium]